MLKRSGENSCGDYTLRHKRRLIQNEVNKSMEPILKRIHNSTKNQENYCLEEYEFSQIIHVGTNIKSIKTENHDGEENLFANHNVLQDPQQINDFIADHNFGTEQILFNNMPWDCVDDNVILQDSESEYRYSECSSDEETDFNNSAYVSSTVNNIQVNVCTHDSVNVADVISKQFKCMLPTWALENYITKTAFTDLLHRIRNEIPALHLPLDSRTLSATPVNAPIYSISGGEYCHFGLETCLQNIAIERRSNCDENIDIDLLINVDGAPMGNSSEKNLWPILCSERLNKKVQIIGVYYGTGKPDDANEFLKYFVDEMKDFVTDGILVFEIRYNVTIDGIICDAPAKSFLLGTKNHTGYLCCSKCDIYGVWIKTVCFPGESGILRTDEEFRAFSYYNENKGYQLKRTILNRIPKLGLVTRVPLDPMHLVFLGVVRKLFLILMFGKVSCKLPFVIISNISKVMLQLADYITYEFARRPRQLTYIKNFKATELRQICLYTGVIVLKNHVSSEVYKHFLLLHVAISILSNRLFCNIETWITYAESLNGKFVQNFSKLYGRRYLSYNVHNMYHLADDVRRFGELENFSAFRFENFIGHLKKLVRSGRQPLQQLMRRCAEIESSLKKVPNKQNNELLSIQQPHSEGPITDNFQCVQQFKVAIFNSYKINCSDNKNNYVYIDNKYVVKIRNFIVNDKDEKYFIGYVLKIIGPFYTYPCSSSKLGISVVEEDVNVSLEYWNVDRITAKLLKLPYGKEFVVFPILHTLREVKYK